MSTLLISSSIVVTLLILGESLHADGPADGRALSSSHTYI